MDGLQLMTRGHHSVAISMDFNGLYIYITGIYLPQPGDNGMNRQQPWGYETNNHMDNNGGIM
jgi:hypothetical protein